MYKNGEINWNGQMNGYRAATVPVIFENNSAGYMQMPHVWLNGPRCYAEQYLERGFVYVTCGNRGSDSEDQQGRLCGKSPANLIDLKTAIRFLRHNAGSLPGDLNRIISVGWSAGGAMSTLLGVTGNNENYIPYLEENGAFMEERDDIYGAQIYCPIIDLEHADLAYEWMFRADKENEDSPAGPAGTMTSFQEALSEKLKEKYAAYFNSLELVHPDDGTPLRLNNDGRSGTGYEYLMEKLQEAASIYLKKLEAGELDKGYSSGEYLSGCYEYETVAPAGDSADKDNGQSDLMQGHAEPFKPPVVTVRGKDKSLWLKWDGNKAEISDLDSYVLCHRRRMKPCTAFDTAGMDSGENRVFGTNEENYMHFCVDIADAISQLGENYPKEYQKYYAAYLRAADDKELEQRIRLINPLKFISTEEKSNQAEYFRIRVGASDADTSLSVSMTLALKLKAAGKNVDYALVWEQPHCEADYSGEVCNWIEDICPRSIN